MKTPEANHDAEREARESKATLEVESFDRWKLNPIVPEELEDGRFYAEIEVGDTTGANTSNEAYKFGRLTNKDAEVECLYLMVLKPSEHQRYTIDFLHNLETGVWVGLKNEGWSNKPWQERRKEEAYYGVRGLDNTEVLPSAMAAELKRAFGELPAEHSIEEAVNTYVKLYSEAQEEKA